MWSERNRRANPQQSLRKPPTLEALTLAPATNPRRKEAGSEFCKMNNRISRDDFSVLLNDLKSFLLDRRASPVNAPVVPPGGVGVAAKIQIVRFRHATHVGLRTIHFPRK